MNNPKKLHGLILAGGFSKRMGQDKALINYHGKPQIEFLFDLLTECCDSVFISKRNDQTLPSADRPACRQAGATDHSYINDDLSFKGGGPLVGILSAMKAYPNASWLVIACDLPFVTQETLQLLIRQRDLSKLATAFKSSHDQLPEPLCAIWESHGYERILDLFNQGIHCPRKMLIKNDVKLLDQKNPRWLDNVNELTDLNQAFNVFKKVK